mgnify:CR=1 FL=1
MCQNRIRKNRRKIYKKTPKIRMQETKKTKQYATKKASKYHKKCDIKRCQRGKNGTKISDNKKRRKRLQKRQKLTKTRPHLKILL